MPTEEKIQDRLDEICMFLARNRSCKDIGEELLKNIIGWYSSIPEVTAIVGSANGDYLELNVFTVNPAYDHEIMDKLLDVEISIMDEFSGLVICLHYYYFDPKKQELPQMSSNEVLVYIRYDTNR